MDSIFAIDFAHDPAIFIDIIISELDTRKSVDQTRRIVVDCHEPGERVQTRIGCDVREVRVLGKRER